MNKGKILAENGGLGVELEPEAVCCEDDAMDGEEGHAMFGHSVNSSTRRCIWRWVHEVGEDEAWRGTVVAHEQSSLKIEDWMLS